jgi:hypothetical protein
LRFDRATGKLGSLVMEGADMHAEERYAEAERIAARMGFHRVFTQVATAQGEAAELAGARVRAARRERRRSVPVR